jgi:hypothetical protein
MAYTLGAIVTKVQQRIRDTGYSSTEIMNYINDTQNDIFNEYRLPFMETIQDYTVPALSSDITDGDGLPANYVQALDLLLTTSGQENPIFYRDVRVQDAEYPDSEDLTAYSTGTPRYWYAYADTIRVFPVPTEDETVKLRYYKKPIELTSDASVPEVPSEFAEILVVGAAYRVLQVKDNYDQAGVLQNKYDELLQKLVFKYSFKQVGTAPRMRINRRRTRNSQF